MRKGQTWLQEVVCTGDLKAIAVTSQTWHCGIWLEEEVEITNSKTDYIFVDACAAEKLSEQPAQPSEAQLQELSPQKLSPQELSSQKLSPQELSCWSCSTI